MESEFPFYAPLFISLMLTFATAIIAANCLVLGLMIWRKSLRVIPNFFLGSLAVSDLISGIMGIPLCIACFGTEEISVCVTSAISVRFTAVSSVSHLLLIASDRYAMIVHSMRYDSLVTKARAIGAICVTWVFALTASVIQLSWYTLDGDMDEHQERTATIDTVYSLFCLLVFIVLPLSSMVYLYGRVFIISIGHIKTLQRLGFKTRDKSVISNYRGVITLVSMLIVFTICWLPFFIVALLDHIEALNVPLSVGIATIFLRFSVPVINPLLCVFGKRDLSAAFRRLCGFTRFKTHATVTARFPQSFNAHRRCVQQENRRSYSENPASPRITINAFPEHNIEMTETLNT